MANFVKQEKLVDSAKNKKDAAQLGTIDLSNNKILRSVHEIDFGKKAKHQIAIIEINTNVDIIKAEMKSCFIELKFATVLSGTTFIKNISAER